MTRQFIHERSFANGEELAVAATFFDPTEAYIVQGCLMAAGVSAEIADVNIVQTYGLLTPALGGVRLLVAKSLLLRAHQIIEAYRRGDFALKDDIDVGEA